jgi:cytochrome c-type biogenesis protein CcmE
VLALVALAAIVGAGLLAASALKDEAAYFYAPADVEAKGVEPGRAIRLGGMVVKGSLKRAADGVTIRFDVTDGKATVPATFSGIAPDLFKEGSGVVAEGAFDNREPSSRPTCSPSMTNAICRGNWRGCSITKPRIS